MDEHLLLVDPEEGAPTLAERLRDAGFLVDHVVDGTSAIARIGVTAYDGVVSELNMRPVSGLDVCRALRANPRAAHVPLVFLSARAEEIDRVVAFEVGADDFVARPYSDRELVLRLRARLRRAARPATPPPARLKMGPFEIDPTGHRASLGGRPLSLTRREFDLLTALVRRGGSVVTRESLQREVWQLAEDVDSRTLDTHLRRLREKLGPAGSYLRTIRGVGYRIVVTDGVATDGARR